MADGSSGGIAAYYDSLSGFLDLAHRLGRGGGATQGATHRFLTDETGGTDTAPERLDLLVLNAAIDAGLSDAPRVLDAGCGLGGTIFRWQARVGGRYDGLTLSPEQCRRAEEDAARRGLGEACHFHLRNYHDPIPGPYDAAIAIESLAHSPDPAAAVAQFATALAPGGLLLIVDDMPDGVAGGEMLGAFKTHWRCPVLADLPGFRAAIAAAGLKVFREVDLTARLRPRPLIWLRTLIAIFGVMRRVVPRRGLGDVLDALLGGFLLEALYRTDAIHYRLIVAVKPRST